MKSSRRNFLASTALTLSAASRSFAAPPPDPLGDVGFQLYTVRGALGPKTAATLQAIDQIGYREIEVLSASLDAIWPDLKKTHLKPVSVHVDSSLFLPDNAAKLNETIAHCKELGLQYAVYPYLPPKERGGIEKMKALADVLNRAGEQCRKAGMGFCYHNHAFEFEPMEGTNGMDTLLTRTDKNLVGWEMDMFWVSVGGHDPVEMLQKHKGRVPLLHLKDKAAGTPNQYTEAVPRTAFREVGNGALDVPAVLKAANAAGVKHYFVEQDQAPGDPVDSLRQSFEYLRKLKAGS